MSTAGNKRKTASMRIVWASGCKPKKLHKSTCPMRTHTPPLCFWAHVHAWRTVRFGDKQKAHGEGNKEAPGEGNKKMKNKS